MNMVKLYSMRAADVPKTGEIAVVRDMDCESFYVSRGPSGTYVLRNATHFATGSTVVKGFDSVRRTIGRA